MKPTRPITFTITVEWPAGQVEPVQALKWLAKRLGRMFAARCTACDVRPPEPGETPEKETTMQDQNARIEPNPATFPATVDVNPCQQRPGQRIKHPIAPETAVSGVGANGRQPSPRRPRRMSNRALAAVLPDVTPADDGPPPEPCRHRRADRPDTTGDASGRPSPKPTGTGGTPPPRAPKRPPLDGTQHTPPRKKMGGSKNLGTGNQTGAPQDRATLQKIRATKKVSA